MCKSKAVAPSNRKLKDAMPELTRIRPQRIAAKKQQERMAIWTTRLNDQHVDWFDNDEIEFSESLENNDTDESTIPVIEMDDYMRNPWQEVKE